MGANSSALSGEENGPGPLRRTELEDIPESCMALILCYLDLPEIIKLAGLNRAFRAASSADFIWDQKLPSTYPFILSKLTPDQGKSKMDIYIRLCRPNPIDGGTKEVWVDRKTGGVCLAISSKAMAITGIDDRRYWNHIPTDESRFQTFAYLQQMWWLQVDGDLEFKLPAGTYSMFFRLQLGRICKRLGRRVCNSDNVHGWNKKPAHFQLTTHDGQRAESRWILDNIGNWLHYHIGDFFVKDHDSLTKIKFSLTQIDCTHTKGGLCVDSVLICPVSLGKQMFSVDGQLCKMF
ncbi:F-box protein PP2-A13-like [Primulina tabacum]|uniref:F-box protein PP2-A13-like n=1 Tax=Primulina tabacum TaxID=48773 RepID=UPI003F5935CC